MQELSIGATQLYNLANNPSEKNNEIDQVRNLHSELDRAVAHAYGWGDLAETLSSGRRFQSQRFYEEEVLDRLLQLNNTRSR